MKVPNLRLLFIVGFAMCLPGTTSLLAALPEPLLHYIFEDSAAGTSVENIGTLEADYDMALSGTAKLGGSGPFAGSGQALDLTGAAAMNGAGGICQLATAQAGHTGLSAMTVTGWIKKDPTTTIAQSVRIAIGMASESGNSYGWDLVFYRPTQLRLSIYSGVGTAAQGSYASDANSFNSTTDEWQFFAVSWSATGGATWYVGTPSSAPVAKGSVSTPATMGSGAQSLTIGSTATGGNSFKGYMDDFRVYNVALTAEEVAEVYSAAGGTGIQPRPLPETPAAWVGDTDTRRTIVRPLYLSLLKDAVAAGANRVAQLDAAEAGNLAISHYTISHGYALALIASLYDPADLTPGQKATRDEYILNARRIFLAVNAAVQNPAERAGQAGGLAFGLGAHVKLYRLLRDDLGAFTPAEQTQAEQQLGDCAQALLELSAEYGSFNRSACNAYGIAAVAKTVPGDSRVSAWNAYADAIWNDWKHVDDTFEDARGYNGLWLHTTLCHADEISQLDALKADAGAKKLFERYIPAVAPSGAMPDYGGSSWTHALELWLPAFERLGHMYDRGDFLLNAQRIAGFIKRSGYIAGQISGLIEAVRLASPDSPADTTATYQDAVATTRISDYGDTLFDKLYLRGNETHFVAVDLHDQGYHGRNDSGALGLYSTGTHALLHTMGREATFANEQQGVVAAPSATNLLDNTKQHAPDEWTRWLVHIRWPGTYAGGPVLDISHVKSISFRLNAPGYTGSVTLDVESVVGVKADGTEETLNTGWSGTTVFENGAVTSGGTFVGPPAFATPLDLSPYKYCYVKWKSNHPAAMQYFVFNGNSLMAPAEPNSSSLRNKASALTLDAYADSTDAVAAKGGLTRLMLDSAGRKITHKRDLALRKSDGTLLVLDTFEFDEAGHYTVGAAWHMQNLLAQGADYIIARDDAQQGSGSSAIAEVPCAVRFDFSASSGENVAIINGPDYTLGPPQTKHFAAALSGARTAGEKVSVLTVLRPDAAQSIAAPTLMNVGQNNGKPYANYVDAVGPLQIGEDPLPVSTMILGFTPQAIIPDGAVTITGVNFFDVTGVRIGGVDVPATGYSVNSLTSITVNAVPSGIATPSGYVQVITTSDTATSPQQYSIASAPSDVGALPTALIVTSGRGFVLLASAAGNPPPTFKWQILTLTDNGIWRDIDTLFPDIDGSSALLTMPSLGAPFNGSQFRYAAINYTGTVYSAPVTLTLEEERFLELAGLVLDRDGNIYVADRGDHTIKQITTDNTITTFAGASGTAGNAIGYGSYARFRAPSDLVIGGDGALYVADTENSMLRRVSGDGISTLFASAGAGSADGYVTVARFNNPSAITVATDGSFYIADTLNHIVRRITPAGMVTTLAGISGTAGALDGPSDSAQFSSPRGIAVSGTGDNAIVYVADTGNHTVRAIASGSVITLAGVSGSAGYADGIGPATLFDGPRGMAVDADGFLYIADTGNSIIRELNTATREVDTVAGTPTFAGRADGGPLTALFDHPGDVALADNGILYIADTGNAAIRKIDLADNVSSVSISGTNPRPPPPAPSPGNTSGKPDNSNHGGGAPSLWLLAAMLVFVAARTCRRSGKGNWA